MNNILNSMMSKYPEASTDIVAKNAVKQVLQEITLCGLGRSDFFQSAAFNGGTALRIFHNLPRFSEDLDFSVDTDKINSFKLGDYCTCVNNELASLGIPALFEIDSEEGFVRRAYIKGNCREILHCFGINDSLVMKSPANEIMKIKIEADSIVLSNACFETKYLLQPYPTSVRLYDRATLFAGKIAAVLSRKWKSRVKGRDLYDYLFYISNNYPLNLAHLESRLRHNGYIKTNDSLDQSTLKQLLIANFRVIDYSSAKLDVAPFITDRKLTDFWSAELFITVTENYNFK